MNYKRRKLLTGFTLALAGLSLPTVMSVFSRKPRQTAESITSLGGKHVVVNGWVLLKTDIS